MAPIDLSTKPPRDLLGRPGSALFWWGLPLVVGWSADLLKVPKPAEVLVWAAALAWMGLGCALGARRCHRLHCYISAPVLFTGAVSVAVVGLGVTPLNALATSYIINGALGLALLSFLPEAMFGKHLTR